VHDEGLTVAMGMSEPNTILLSPTSSITWGNRTSSALVLKKRLPFTDVLHRRQGANPEFDENFSRNINEREAILGDK
jgi:hypothetical protein